MNCPWYEQQFAGGEALWVEGRPSSVLEEHARQCASCEKMIAAEIVLLPILRELGSSSQEAVPSARVRDVLLDELRSRRPVRKARFAVRWAFAVAALLCVATVLLGWRFVTERRSPMVQVPMVRSTVSPPPIEPVKQPAVAATTSRSPKPTMTRATKLPASRDGFYPVVMCDSLSCDGPTVEVRVEVPTSPLTGRRDSQAVVTDLLVGEDGLVRGVRVLQ